MLTFGLTAPYILLPVGFGQLFHQLLADNMEKSGLAVNVADIPFALLIPVGGMVIGLLIAIFFLIASRASYVSNEGPIEEDEEANISAARNYFFFHRDYCNDDCSNWTQSMVFGALSGILVLYFTVQ